MDQSDGAIPNIRWEIIYQALLLALVLFIDSGYMGKNTVKSCDFIYLFVCLFLRE